MVSRGGSTSRIQRRKEEKKVRNVPYKYLSSPAHSRVGGPRAPPPPERDPYCAPFPLAQAQAQSPSTHTHTHPNTRPAQPIFAPIFASPHPTTPHSPQTHHVRRLFAKVEEGAAGNSNRTGRSRQESGWCVSRPTRFFSSPSVAPIPSAT